MLNSTVRSVARSYSYLPKGGYLVLVRFCRFSANSQAYEGNFTVKKEVKNAKSTVGGYKKPDGEDSSLLRKTGFLLRQTPWGGPSSDHVKVYWRLGSGCNDRLVRSVDID